jgi:hypothetical protein
MRLEWKINRKQRELTKEETKLIGKIITSKDSKMEFLKLLKA